MGIAWFKHQIRVRYQETDQMGVVYHANYLNWFEIGRTEMIRQMGITYFELEAQGLLLPLVEAEMKFRLPARYDEIITIYTRIAEYSNVRMKFESELRRLGKEEVNMASEDGNDMEDDQPVGELLVSGVTRHVWLNRSWKPVRIDKEAPALFKLISEGK